MMIIFLFQTAVHIQYLQIINQINILKYVFDDNCVLPKNIYGLQVVASQ